MHLFPQRAPLQELGGEILKLVSYGATPEQWAEWLRVPLEHAVARGNLDLVNALLRAGADGNAGWRGCRGRTMLDAAAVGGNPDVVTALLGAGAEPDVNVVSMTPKRSALFVATACGHEDVARRLIQAGADVRFEDPVRQCSVLHVAAYDGHEQLVNDLLMAGADPNSFAEEYDTPLHQAAAAGHAVIVSTLLTRGGDADAQDSSLHGMTPLISAAEWGRLGAVETLLAAGAAFNNRTSYGDSALDMAAQEGHIPVLKAILRHGADVNSTDETLGFSALHKAAMRNQAGAIDALVDAGADVELSSYLRATPLCVAALFSKCESMLALLKRGAMVSVHNESGRHSPLHTACSVKRWRLEMTVGLLLRWGADETAVNEYGDTPAGLLNERAPNDRQRHCSQEEVERTRILLARAPADRA